MTMELQELRDQLAQLQSENVLALDTTLMAHQLNSPTYGGSDSSPGGGKLQPPDVRSQTSGGESTGSSTHRAAQEQAAPNLIAPCPKLLQAICGGFRKTGCSPTQVARPGTPLPNEVQLAIKCTSVATQCAMSVIPERSTDDVKVLQQADPAIAPVLAFIQRQCAPGRMEREALDPAARRLTTLLFGHTSGQRRPQVTGWTPTSPTYGQPCPQLTTKTLYPSDSRPAS
uniref:Uncharacterized protein n=1 Tax=Knipowitschia caucasica TaxID=637954 RepID=A0AAV2M0T5_KNICA